MTITLPELSPANVLVGSAALWYAVAAVCIRCNVLESFYLVPDPEGGAFERCMCRLFSWLFSPVVVAVAAGVILIAIPLGVGWLLGGGREPVAAAPVEDTDDAEEDTSEAGPALATVAENHTTIQAQLADLRERVRQAKIELDKRKEDQP